MKRLLLSIISLFLVHSLSANNVYVGNYSRSPGTVSIFNTVTNQVTGIVNDPDSTFGEIYYIVVTPNGQTAYVANAETDTISIVNVATNTVTGLVDPLPLPHAGNFDNFVYSMNITPDGKTLYAIAEEASTVYVIDIASNSLVGPVTDPFDSFDFPYFMAITPDGSTAYVANYSSDTVSIINVATNTVTAVLTDPTFHGPFPLVMAPNGETLYIGNYSTGTVSILDVATNKVTGTVTDTGHTMASIYYLAITPDGKTLYADNFSHNTISIVNTATNTVTGVISDPSFDEVYYLAITPNGKTMYAANYGGASVSIINTATNTVTGLVADPNVTFDGPYPIAIIPAPQPSNVMGMQIKNIFLTQLELVNIITWSAPTTGTPPFSYAIYYDAGLTMLAGTIPATGPLKFIDHDRVAGVTYTYYIVAIDQFGNISPAVSVTVTPLKLS